MPPPPGKSKPPPLEDFAPPSNYRFEPELQETPPRHVPDEFRNSPYFLRQRNTLVRLLLAGALCVAFGQLSILKEWGLYVLPLAYLSWIGAGLLLLGLALGQNTRPAAGPRPRPGVELNLPAHGFRQQSVRRECPGHSCSACRKQIFGNGRCFSGIFVLFVAWPLKPSKKM